jgi:hypothetical protein
MFVLAFFAKENKDAIMKSNHFTSRNPEGKLDVIIRGGTSVLDLRADENMDGGERRIHRKKPRML